ncbi:hypothetical protein QA641_35485 [Bradyrhizobium sp. CB1650]|uniref:hypothetical protein n=1 Tax=Bradyrhizobium sp. CB1650 TaxID=3039153 RepID=UPI002434E441|nr:hypothetical protein [Bradyrhizobium sp. CB1650]WGD50841.1 hypothetical protein QA641_35485 [Bradyrhizobium sp. CB1650]
MHADKRTRLKLQQKQPNLTRPGAIRQLIDPVIGVDLKELTLLVITLGGYLAGRLCGEREIRRRTDDDRVRGDGGRRAGDVVALIQQWLAPHGKSMVFGQFDPAPAAVREFDGFLPAGLADEPVPCLWCNRARRSCYGAACDLRRLDGAV